LLAPKIAKFAMVRRGLSGFADPQVRLGDVVHGFRITAIWAV